MKKLRLLSYILLLIMTTCCHNIFAAYPDAFVVDVQPSSFEPGTAVDMTVKAVDANGTIISDYEGDVYIDVLGSIDASEYVVPSEHLYTFLPQDQGIKVFSKGLIIKKSGVYTVHVSDITQDDIKGEKSIIVGATSSANIKKININSPLKGGTEKNEVINFFGTAPDLPNSPFEVWLNNMVVYQGVSDSVGGLNGYITGAINGENKLQIKVLNISNVVIGESDVINFVYEPIADGIFNSIQILPGTKVKQGTMTTFMLSTNDSVSSSQIVLSDGKTFPLDLDKSGIFKKDVLMDKEGVFNVSVDLMVGTEKKSYSGVSTIIVEKGTSIGKIRTFGDPIVKTKLNITWETIGDPTPKYRLLYGTDKTNLSLNTIVTSKEIVLENLTIGQKYYFQIVPLSDDGTQIGIASEIFEANIGQETSSCVVNGIKVNDIKIGDKHYLIWTGVINVEKYIIYKSDYETNDISRMSKVAELTGTMFEYPFNPDAKVEKYSYYVVQAICTDGSGLMIDNVKKVVTGPVENILLFLAITLFVYCCYKLYVFKSSNG